MLSFKKNVKNTHISVILTISTYTEFCGFGTRPLYNNKKKLNKEKDDITVLIYKW